MITTPWIMTVFTGSITDPKYILPILDNFIISIYNQVDEKDLPNLSWIFIFSVILTIFQKNQDQLLKLEDFRSVADFFQNMQDKQEFGFNEGP